MIFSGHLLVDKSTGILCSAEIKEFSAVIKCSFFFLTIKLLENKLLNTEQKQSQHLQPTGGQKLFCSYWNCEHRE